MTESGARVFISYSHRTKRKDEVGRMKDERAYPWESAEKDLAEARQLIES